MNEKKRAWFTTVDVALIVVFSALWAALNLTIGKLGFTLFRLPIFCDFAVFFTLLLTVWMVGKFGAASIVGIIGAIIVSFLAPSAHLIGFSASSILFDVLMLVNKHRLRLKIRDLWVAASVTVISAYFAGVVIGIFFMGRPLDEATLQWALTIWGGWHLVGGIIGAVIALPIIGVLEGANVRRIKGDS
jgi:hypothetical protein